MFVLLPLCFCHHGLIWASMPSRMPLNVVFLPGGMLPLLLLFVPDRHYHEGIKSRIEANLRGYPSTIQTYPFLSTSFRSVPFFHPFNVQISFDIVKVNCPVFVS